MLWKVDDYFLFHDVNIERPNRIDLIDQHDLYKSLCLMVSKKNKDDKCKKLYIGGQAGRLEVAADNDKNKIIFKYDEKIAEERSSLISLLAFTSYPDVHHGICLRKRMSLKANKIASSIEPQSIDVYNRILFNYGDIKKYLNNDPSNSSFNAFSGKKCILIIFQVFSGYLHESVKPSMLFNGIREIDESIEIVFYGLTSGLSDGIVLLTCNNGWESGLSSLIKKIMSKKDADNFYDKIYPLAIFILEEYPHYTQKANIKYLIKSCNE